MLKNVDQFQRLAKLDDGNITPYGSCMQTTVFDEKFGDKSKSELLDMGLSIIGRGVVYSINGIVEHSRARFVFFK